MTFHVRERPIEEEAEERLTNAWTDQWEADKYCQARKGDHMVTPFECDRCIFLKLKGRFPIPDAPKDVLLLGAIRRVNLDAFWSRASTTVRRNLDGVKKTLYTSASVGLKGPFKSFGPMPSFDHCGYEIAVDMVLASKGSGRHCKDHVQFKTIRKLRTSYGNFERISSLKAHSSLGIDLGAGDTKDIVALATSSIWFRRFVVGCKARMGQIYKPNLALPTELILKLLDLLAKQVNEAEKLEDQFDVIVFGSFIIYSYVLSLRGVEGTMINLATLVKYLENTRDCLVIGLKGKFKGEANEKDHLFYCVNETSSGIKVRKWTELLISVHAKAGRKGGPCITDWKGKPLEISALDDRLHSSLEVLLDAGEKFPLGIESVEDIAERVSVFRSLRRASATRALDRKVAESDIDIVNRWKSVEEAKGSKPKRSMRQHYAEVANLKQPFLRYTYAM